MIRYGVSIGTLWIASDGQVLAMGEILEEEWTSGSFICVVRMPAGLQAEFLDIINSKTKGKAQIKVLERIS